MEITRDSGQSPNASPAHRLDPSTQGSRFGHDEAVRRGTGTKTIQEAGVDVRLDEGDHDRFAHYVEKGRLTEALVNGTPVIALCGKVWVPSRDPERFPVCPECKRLYEMGPEGRRREWEERAQEFGSGESRWRP